MVIDYWSKCDLDFIHGDGAESFAAFRERVIKGLKNLQNLEQKFIIVFVQGQVIRATGNEPLNMEIFRDKILPFEASNASIFECNYEGMNWQILQLSISLR